MLLRQRELNECVLHLVVRIEGRHGRRALWQRLSGHAWEKVLRLIYQRCTLKQQALWQCLNEHSPEKMLQLLNLCFSELPPAYFPQREGAALTVTAWASTFTRVVCSSNAGIG